MKVICKLQLAVCNVKLYFSAMFTTFLRWNKQSNHSKNQEEVETYLHLSKLYRKMHAVKPKCLANGIINDLQMLHLQN